MPASERPRNARARWCPTLLALTLSCASLPSPAADERRESLRLGADLHLHFGMKDALPFHAGEPGRGAMAGSHDALWVNQVSPAQLERAGVRLIVAALWPALDLRPDRDVMDEALAQLHGLERLTRREPRFAKVGSVVEAREALRVGKLALWPCLEGGEAIRRVEDVDVLFAAGARCVGLVHFVDNALGDADHQLGELAGSLLSGEDRGLSELGEAAVGRMFELGMVIDLAHAGPRTLDEVLTLAEAEEVPVLYSHAGSAGHQARTLAEPFARRIGALGGLIGIGLFRSPLFRPVPEEERWEGFEEGTCDEVAAHWLHYARVAGEGAVLLGSDFNGPILRAAPGGGCPNGIRNAGDLRALFDALVAHGVARERLEDSGERLLRLLGRVEERADPDARREAARTKLPTPAPFDWPL